MPSIKYIGNKIHSTTAFLLSSFLLFALLKCCDLVLTQDDRIGKTELSILNTVPAEKDTGFFNVWSQDGLLSPFSWRGTRRKKCPWACGSLPTGLPCLVPDSLNPSSRSGMGPGAPFSAGLKGHLLFDQGAAGSFTAQILLSFRIATSVFPLPVTGYSVARPPSDLCSISWMSGEGELSAPFYADPGTFDFMWFSLYSLGEENAWPHRPLKTSLLTCALCWRQEWTTLGLLEAPSCPSRELQWTSEWWPAATSVSMGDGDADPTFNPHCTHPMRVERWGGHGQQSDVKGDLSGDTVLWSPFLSVILGWSIHCCCGKCGSDVQVGR